MEDKIINIIKQIPSFIIVTVGAALAAAALEVFLVPNLIIDGGITGVSILLNKITGFSLSLAIVIINIPFFILGLKNMGKKFVFKAVYAILIFTILLEVFSGIADVTDDVLLATIYGGLLLGIGVGLVIRGGACLDGTEVIAIMLSKKSSVSVGQVVLCFNIIIYGVAAFILGPDRALYSMLMYFVTFKLIDLVSDEFNQAKAAIIITEKEEKISDAIFNELGRTVTMIDGVGKVSKTGKSVLYTVITRLEVSRLKDIVAAADVSSFVAISDVTEVIGNHIKKIPVKGDINEKK